MKKSSTFHETPTVPSKQFLFKYNNHKIIVQNKTEFLQYFLQLTNVGMMLENSQEFLTFAIWISKTLESNTLNSYISDEFTRAFEYAKGRNYVYGRIYHYLNLLQEFIKHELHLNKSYHHHIVQRSHNRSHKSFLNEPYIFKLRYNGDMLYNKSIKKLIGNPKNIKDESKFDYNSLGGNLKTYNFVCGWLKQYLDAEFIDDRTDIQISNILNDGLSLFYNLKRQYTSNKIFIKTYVVLKDALLSYWSTNTINNRQTCRIMLAKLYDEFKSNIAYIYKKYEIKDIKSVKSKQKRRRTS